ncbi:hypothetical protein BC943DRAFT_352171 [Umbelopsis sp. AD052]|nr:hypothetical protein BC943DRAFT_352171 [Umbelopsis sp. AD052]
MGERKGIVREFHFVDMEDPNRYKRLKVLRACDFCRKRKVKCDLPQPNSGTCSNCQRARQPCTFLSFQTGDNAKELSVMTERTALEASKGVHLKQLTIAETDNGDQSKTSDIASISERLLTNYIWDRSSPSHKTNATGKLVLPAQCGHTKQLDMTSICYLLVPDIQPDDQYLPHCVERLAQISRSNPNDIIPADNGKVSAASMK